MSEPEAGAFALSIGHLNEAEARIQKALTLIHERGGADGAHSKHWVLDQVVRALTGCPMVMKTGLDCNNLPHTAEVQGESPEYLEWVRRQRDGEDGPNSYEWENGDGR